MCGTFDFGGRKLFIEWWPLGPVLGSTGLSGETEAGKVARLSLGAGSGVRIAGSAFAAWVVPWLAAPTAFVPQIPSLDRNFSGPSRASSLDPCFFFTVFPSPGQHKDTPNSEESSPGGIAREFGIAWLSRMSTEAVPRTAPKVGPRFPQKPCSVCSPDFSGDCKCFRVTKRN